MYQKNNNSNFSVIFDFDGVIADSMDLINLAVQEILADFNLKFENGEYSEKHAGKIIDDAIEEELNRGGIYLNNDKKSEINQKLNIILKENLENKVQEIKGTKEFILMLKNAGINMAIASGSETWFIKKVLKKFDLNYYFKNITSSTEKEVKKGKPAPDTFLLAAKRLNLKPKNCLVIEDGIGGMEGAKKAGMKVIALDSKNSKRKFPADIVVDNLSKLTFDNLKELF